MKSIPPISEELNGQPSGNTPNGSTNDKEPSSASPSGLQDDQLNKLIDGDYEQELDKIIQDTDKMKVNQMPEISN